MNGGTPKFHGLFHGKSENLPWMRTGCTPMDWKPPEKRPPTLEATTTCNTVPLKACAREHPQLM